MYTCSGPDIALGLTLPPGTMPAASHLDRPAPRGLEGTWRHGLCWASKQGWDRPAPALGVGVRGGCTGIHSLLCLFFLSQVGG